MSHACGVVTSKYVHADNWVHLQKSGQCIGARKNLIRTVGGPGAQVYCICAVLPTITNTQKFSSTMTRQIFLILKYYKWNRELILRVISLSMRSMLKFLTEIESFTKRNTTSVRLQFLTAVAVNSSVCWDITLCSWLEVIRRFGGTYCLHILGWSASQASFACCVLVQQAKLSWLTSQPWR